jgi:hypothetical protein
LERVDLAITRSRWDSSSARGKSDGGYGVRMRARQEHKPESGTPLEVKQGDELKFERRPTEYAGWIWCISPDGVSAWVPESWVKVRGEKCVMQRDYVSREAKLVQGDEVSAVTIESGWAWVRNAAGEEGWVPLGCLEEIDT